MRYRHIPFSQTLNARDLGGYPTLDGGITRWNVFYRSGCPFDVQGDDLDLFKKLNIGAVIDLRSGASANEVPALNAIDGLKRYFKSLGDDGVPQSADLVPQCYLQMLSHTQSLKEIFDIFATEKLAVMFHCFAGKDRTGVISALLLMLAGVSDEEIVADYSLSHAYFIRAWENIVNLSQRQKFVLLPSPERMDGFLRLFRQTYGTAQDFLQEIGVSTAQQQAIIQKFVERPD